MAAARFKIEFLKFTYPIKIIQAIFNVEEIGNVINAYKTNDNNSLFK